MYDYYLNKDYAERQNLLVRDFYSNPLLNDSISFFTEVNLLKKTAEKANDKELLFETEFMFFNFYSSRNYANYKKEMKRFIAKLDASKIRQLQARARHAIGLHYFFEDMNYAKAIDYLEESYAYILKLSEQELPDKQELIYNIAYVYYTVGYNNMALKYLEIAQSVKRTYYDNLQLNIIHTQGLIYKAQGKERETLNYFNTLYKQAELGKNAIWFRIAQNNLGDVYMRLKRYDKALEVMQAAPFVIRDEHIDFDITVRRKQLLALNYIKLQEQDKVLQIIKELKDMFGQTNEDRIPAAVLHLFAYEEGKRGHFDDAFQWMEKTLAKVDESNRLKTIELVKQLDDKDQIDKYFHQQIELEHIKRTRVIILFGTIVIILLLSVLAFVLLKKQNIKHKEKEREIELEKNRIGEELQNAQRELMGMTASLLLKNKQVEDFRKEIKTIEESNTKDEILIERANRLNHLMSLAIITDEDWINFKRAFEAVHGAYMERLTLRMPTLTQAELRYIILRKLELSSKEIAAILGISFDSIRTYKYRIRKKYGIKDDETLAMLIVDI